MTDSSTDTIAAIATPPGRGGVGIVRISGPMCAEVASEIIGQLPDPRQASFCRFLDKDQHIIDTGLAIYFPAPHSFTGEDVLELHGHGGPVVMDMLMQRILSLGVRAARPGEFSEHAFLNDKIDLTQAEAIADLIDSGTAQAARAAQNSLQGEFSRQIHALVEAITSLRMYVEAAIDFPEEEVDFLSDGKITTALEDLLSGLEELFASARQGCLLKEGMHVVIAGRPNVGKSSLLNQLAGRDSAIVTEIPGTTRDVLREHIQIDGMPLHVIDTAGLRDSSDVVEREGMRRAWAEIENSDRLLLLIDDSIGFAKEEETILKQLPASLAVTRVFNKIDLSGKSPHQTETEHGTEIHVSAKTGEGIEQLRAHLTSAMGYQHASEGSFSARRRHLDALERARDHIESGKQQLEQAKAGELLAEELRQAQQVLGEITGEVSSDDLLGKIFSSFCIGK